MKVNVKIKLGDKTLLDLDNQKLNDGELRIDKAISQLQFNAAKDDDNNARLTVEFS